MQRLNYIDRLKGFAILTVVAGHVYLFGMDHSESIWQDVIGSFHMPLFMYMSGYLALTPPPPISRLGECAGSYCAFCAP